MMVLGIVSVASGQHIPKGFILPKYTHSPDHRYGVLVPIFDLEHPENEPNDSANSVVELKTGRIIATINAETGYNRTLNHRGIPTARWSADSSLLVWTVSGKWVPYALVALKIEKGEVQWQVDILKTAQKATLSRTKKAAPQQYEAVKKEVERVQAICHDPPRTLDLYPDGFTIGADVEVPIGFPLKVHVVLTSNPKQIESLLTLDSHLDAVIMPDGKFVVTDFQVERNVEVK